MSNFPKIQNQFFEFEKWVKRYESDPSIDMVFKGQHAFEQYLHRAIKLRDKLLNTSLPQILTHGDLHHNNLLWNGKSWVVIDPKGIIGPAISETWAFITDIEHDTKYIAQFFNYDLQFLREWYFIRIVLSTCWCLEDNVSPEFFFRLATKAALYIE